MRRLGMRRRDEWDFVDQRFAPESEVNPQVVYSVDDAEWPMARVAALN